MKLKFLTMTCLFGMNAVGLALAGGHERIGILLDSGTNDRGTRQIGEWMERDLNKVLDRRGGYKSRNLRSKDEFKRDAGEYLLDVRITRYNSGSKAARLIVGFGAGAASLDIHYEFIGPHGNVLLSKDDGCGTSLDWQRLARKLNENMLDAIQARLRAGNLDENVVVPAQVAPPRAEVVTPPAAVAQPVPLPVAPVNPPAAVAPAPETVSQPAAPQDPVEQLRQLDAMKKQRLISDSEYKQKRKEILSRL